jgi:hypothetical protein
MPVEWNWFETDDELLDGRQAAFVKTVRLHAAAWSWCEPHDTCALIDEDDPRELTLIVDVISALSGSITATLGVFLSGDSMQCGETHTQNYALQSRQRVEGLEASGTPQELGTLAASWLERTVPLLR